MSDTSQSHHEPWFILPGFMPDAIGFATRTTASLLLAYFIAFTMQLDSASSAGVCVAIVAQPTAGMALSKAKYRVFGTIVGGIAALGFAAAFPQDRTMLLAAFTLWLGACTFVAALLRDFRSYGAVLCGYTVGIIVVTGIDAPNGAVLATLNRVAAILLGVVCVAAVNTLLPNTVAFETLVAALRQRLAQADELALQALSGRSLPDEPLPAQEAAAVLALRTDATYAGAEVADGGRRSAGAQAAIVGVLGMLSAARAISTGLSELNSPATWEAMAATSAAIRTGGPSPPLETLPPDPLSAALLDRARELLAERALARSGLHLLETGEGSVPAFSLPFHRDYLGAALSAARTIIAVALGCVFCIYSGYANTTGLLVQQAAFTALLGMQVSPASAGMAMGYSLIPAAMVAWLIGFVLMPQVSGFLPFAIAIGSFAFVMALAVRHPATMRFSGGLLLYLTLLVAPSNTESFDLSAFANNVLIQFTAVAFMVLAFEQILPVSPRRRLARVASAITGEIARLLDGDAPQATAAHARVLRLDRLAQAQLWLDGAQPCRLAILRRLSAFSELDSALRRAQAGMRALALPMPPCTPAALLSEARRILSQTYAPTLLPWALHAAAGLYGSALLLRQQGRALRHYGVGNV